MIEIRHSANYTWNPQEDITTFELAELLPFFVIAEEEQDEFYDTLSNKCRRHIIREK